jgi:hypothetical protein
MILFAYKTQNQTCSVKLAKRCKAADFYLTERADRSSRRRPLGESAAQGLLKQ